MLSRRPCPDAQPGERPRHPVAHLLVAADRHLGQVSAVRDARGQPRRGRNPRPDLAHPPEIARSEKRLLPRRARDFWRGAPLRRRHDHPGDLGALGRRRAQGRHPGLRRLGGADHDRYSGRPLSDPAPRNRGHRRDIRPGHDSLVFHPHLPRRPRHPARPVGPVGDRPVAGGELLPAQPVGRVFDPRLGRTRGHRRRGALRRHGALRQEADQGRLVRPGAAGPADQLFRPGRPLDQPADLRRAAGRRRESVLSSGARPTLDPLLAGRPGHDGHRHRVASPDLRRVLAHPPGDPARLLPAPPDRPHLGRGVRPDLRSHRQLGADGLHHRPRGLVPFLHRARRGVRHRGDHDHGDHHVPRQSGRAGGLGLAPPLALSDGHVLPADRPGLFRRQHRQGSPGAAGFRCWWERSSSS